MKTFEQILAITQDAILATGKKFHEIPTESIEGFISNLGVPKNQIKNIYNNLKEEYDNSRKNPTPKYSEKKVDSVTTTVNEKNNYIEKVLNPRKSVFSEVRKIT